jgi:hypothetical protein
VLASIASTAPFVGLFGTVWGIYHALLGIGAAGQVSIDQVAGPIGEALIMTALGLLVAIPAVLAYNALLRGNKRIAHQLNRFAHDLHAYFVTGARVSAGGDGKVLPMKKEGLSHGHRNPGGQRRDAQRDQHDPVHRRHAGAADHLHHHRAGHQARGQRRPAQGQQRAAAGQAGQHPPGGRRRRHYHWNDVRVEDEALAGRLSAAAAMEPQPELHIRGDRAVRYERVAELLSAAQRAGLRKIGFVTEPATP